MESDRKEVGLHCPTCGRWEMPPNRKMDNWTCSHCYSGFLTIAMLNNLIPRNVLAEILQNRRRIQSGHPCILCTKPMEVVPIYRQESQIDVELCRHCQLCWFEGGAFVHFTRILAPEEIQNLKTHLEPPLKGVRAPNLNSQSIVLAKPPKMPWATLSLVISSIFVSAVSTRHPELLAQYGFLSADPLRHSGLTILSSLFFDSELQFHALFLFLIFGTYSERRLGALNHLCLFLSAGILSRISYLIVPPTIASTITGSGPAMAGVLTYVLVGLPYLTYLYPDQKWKSPRNSLGWTAIVALMFFFVFFALDLATQTIVGLSQGHLDYVLPGVGGMPSKAECWAYAMGCLTGLFWFLAGSVIREENPGR